MKKLLVLFGLMFAGTLAIAGTPQVTYFQGQGSLSNTTIIASTASLNANGNFSLTIASPTVTNSGSGAYSGRNCITRFIVQVPTTTAVNFYDATTLKWTIYGQDLGASGPNTLNINEDILGPWCAAVGDQIYITLTGSGSTGVSEAVNVEGYTTYGAGSVVNQGSSY